MGITVCNFRVLKTGLRSAKYIPLYSFPPEAHQGDSDRKKSSLSGDLNLSDLITEELFGPMSFYCGKVRDNDELVCGF